MSSGLLMNVGVGGLEERAASEGRFVNEGDEMPTSDWGDVGGSARASSCR